MGEIEMASKRKIRELKKKFAKIQREKWFSEDNALNAIEKMDESGLGRVGHRNLCKKLGLKWPEYKLALEFVRNPVSTDELQEMTTSEKETHNKIQSDS